MRWAMLADIITTVYHHFDTVERTWTGRSSQGGVEMLGDPLLPAPDRQLTVQTAAEDQLAGFNGIFSNIE